MECGNTLLRRIYGQGSHFGFSHCPERTSQSVNNLVITHWHTGHQDGVCCTHTQELKWLKDDAVSFHSVFINILWERLLPPTFNYFYAVSTQRSLCYNSQYQMLVRVANVTFSELHNRSSILVYVKRSKHVTCLISIWSIRGGSHMRGCIVTQLGCDWSKFF